MKSIWCSFDGQDQKAELSQLSDYFKEFYIFVLWVIEGKAHLWPRSYQSMIENRSATGLNYFTAVSLNNEECFISKHKCAVLICQC